MISQSSDMLSSKKDDNVDKKCFPSFYFKHILWDGKFIEVVSVEKGRAHKLAKN